MANSDIHLPGGALLQGGKYRIVRFISSGGFGCTYEAVHEMLEKRVAIKEFFVRDFCNRDEATAHVTVGTLSKKGLVEKLRKKFIDEAKGLCHLEHPGIVKVSDVFEENGTAYFVMDYVDGKSVGDIVKLRGSLPQAEALGYISQVCDALEYVHSHNRLHLDIKPGNIMVDKDGRAVLIDFGASKQYDEADGENTSTLMGKTPGYAPIEQMGNDVVKFMPATDIYALGATLYKMLTGVTPPSANQLASGEELPALPAGVSPQVRNAITEAMRINKSKRPQSIAEFRKILMDNVTENTIVAQPEQHSYPASQQQPKHNPQTNPEASQAKPQAAAKQEAFQGQKPSPKPKNMLPYIISACCAAAVILCFFIFIKPNDNQINDNPGTNVLDKTIVNSNGVSYKFTGVLYKDSIPNGEGIGKYKEGIYTGQFKDGLRHGKATYRTNDGSNVFEGTYNNDQYQQGRLTFSDGTYYEGTFKNNNFDQGHWYKADGTLDE